MATLLTRGINSTKASGATLTETGVTAREGSMLVVALLYKDTAGDPTSVEWGAGQVSLVRKIKRNNATAGMTLAVYIRKIVQNTRTADVVVTWPSAILAREIAVMEIRGVNGVDDATGLNITTSDANPGTGQTTVLEFPDDFAIAFFGSAGPSEDTVGTLEIENNDVFMPAVSGQRIGTTGGPATNNLTLQTAYLNLDSTASTRARQTGATGRRWSNAILALGGKAWKVTLSGTYTSEIFMSGETAAEVNTDALGLDENSANEMTTTALAVSTVDSTVEQVFGTDYVK